MTVVLVIQGSGCATLSDLAPEWAGIGEPFDTTHLGELAVGAHSKEQIVAWFGEPHRRSQPLGGIAPGCVERWLYNWAEARAGADTVGEVLVIDFDADGKTCDHRYVRIPDATSAALRP